jgi:hypothetical protein
MQCVVSRVLRMECIVSIEVELEGTTGTTGAKFLNGRGRNRKRSDIG